MLLVCFVQNFAGLLVVQVRANGVICFHVFFVRVILVVLTSGIVRLIFHFYCIESSYLPGGDVIAKRSFDIISQCVFLISTETVALQEPCPGTNEEEAFPVAEDDNRQIRDIFHLLKYCVLVYALIRICCPRLHENGFLHRLFRINVIPSQRCFCIKDYLLKAVCFDVHARTL